MDLLRHIFIPHTSNNFRARILHNSSLVLIIFAFLILSAGVYLIRQVQPSVLGISYSINTQELLDDTNKARADNNEPPLSLSPQLSDAARRKAANMFQNNYWAHFGPDGATPWSFIRSAGYDYTYAGENLAKGFTTSQDVVSAWMNSPSHKENVLSLKYKDIGFAIAEGNLQGEDTVLVVQMFGSTEVPAQADTTPNAPQKVASEGNSGLVPLEQVAGQQNINQKVINAPTLTHAMSLAFLIFIITILALDLIVVEKRKVPRLVGHNLDHLILLVLFLVYIILVKAGGIL